MYNNQSIFMYINSCGKRLLGTKDPARPNRLIYLYICVN